MCRYAFEMENDNMTGHWEGLFEETEEGTVVSFTEDVTAKKAAMKPFVGLYLRRQQKRYIEDLIVALGETGN